MVQTFSEVYPPGGLSHAPCLDKYKSQIPNTRQIQIQIPKPKMLSLVVQQSVIPFFHSKFHQKFNGTMPVPILGPQGPIWAPKGPTWAQKGPYWAQTQNVAIN